MDPVPVYHITHWKAGSQWVRGVLEDSCPDRFLFPNAAMQAGAIPTPERPAGIYSPLYMPRWVFDASPAQRLPHRKFIVIRDLRDTLVSWYFSLRYTHEDNAAVAAHRARLGALSAADGLLDLIVHPDFNAICSIPASWLGSPDPLVRYEDLVQDPHACFARIFAHCEIGVPDDRRRAAVDRWLFQNMASRQRGDELRTSHMRKGVAGDWRNHFTPAVSRAFAERYGDLLLRLGYTDA
jgi:lipopolysaccharide transport system ATP-binding protein